MLQFQPRLNLNTKRICQYFDRKKQSKLACLIGPIHTQMKMKAHQYTLENALVCVNYMNADSSAAQVVGFGTNTHTDETARVNQYNISFDELIAQYIHIYFIFGPRELSTEIKSQPGHHVMDFSMAQTLCCLLREHHSNGRYWDRIPAPDDNDPRMAVKRQKAAT